MKKHFFGSFSKQLNPVIYILSLIAFLSAYWMWLDKPPLVSIPTFLFLSSVCLLLIALQTKQWLVIPVLLEMSPRERVEDTVSFMRHGKLQVLLVLIGLFFIFGAQTQVDWMYWFTLVCGIAIFFAGILQFIFRDKIIRDMQKSVRKKKK